MVKPDWKLFETKFSENPQRILNGFVIYYFVKNLINHTVYQDFIISQVLKLFQLNMITK